ncbi:hypothetical protein [Paenibacillus gansuensis]|uniref:Uncharacterized protein n=1 Tax=Paenibacillus gansuensis TaxID=306542 RepID=A0ABW5P6T5_9BACL
MKMITEMKGGVFGAAAVAMTTMTITMTGERGQQNPHNREEIYNELQERETHSSG